MIRFFSFLNGSDRPLNTWPIPLLTPYVYFRNICLLFFVFLKDFFYKLFFMTAIDPSRLETGPMQFAKGA